MSLLVKGRSSTGAYDLFLTAMQHEVGRSDFHLVPFARPCLPSDYERTTMDLAGHLRDFTSHLRRA